MARLPRFVLPGQPQHVIQRGNNRQAIFHRANDYRFYLEKLKAGAEKHQVDIHAYVLMSNHVHLLLTPSTEPGIGKLMQYMGRHYVQHFNHRYERTGTLWEGRYKSSLIDAERYLMACYRYIELNPVRAGMVAEPGAYTWSSYRVNALGYPSEIIAPHSVYRRLGRNPTLRQAAYREMFAAALGEKSINAIREATNKSWVLGSDEFKDKLASKLNRPVKPKARGGDRRSEAFRGQSG